MSVHHLYCLFRLASGPDCTVSVFRPLWWICVHGVHSRKCRPAGYRCQVTYKGTSANHFHLSIDVRASKYSGGVLDNPSLNITNVVPSDEGFYSCNATNLVGTASAWTFFDVYGGMFNRCFGICCENIVLPFW